MTKKRGQLTVFVIISIVIVVAIISSYLLLTQKDTLFTNKRSDSINNDLNYCIDKVTEDSIIAISRSGGYFELPEKVNSLNIPYYFYKNESLTPNIEKIQEEIGKYTSTMLYFCFREMTRSKENVEISSDIDVKTRIRKDDTIRFRIISPYTIYKENNSYSFKKPVEKTLHTRLHTIHGFIKKIIDWQEEEPAALCLNCVYKESERLNISVRLFDITEDDILFSIKDNQEKKKNNSINYLFSIKPGESNYNEPTI